MEKEKAIEILEGLKEKIYQDRFENEIHINDWKRELNSNLHKIFVISSSKKENEVKRLRFGSTKKYQYPKNPQQEIENRKKCGEDFQKFQGRLATLIDQFITEINTHPIEVDENEILKQCERELKEANVKIQSLDTLNEQLRKEIPKTWWKKLVNTPISVFIGAIVGMIGIGAIFYTLGKDAGSTKYDKAKYDVEVKAARLTEDSTKLANENENLKTKIDSLSQAISAKDSLKKKK